MPDPNLRLTKTATSANNLQTDSSKERKITVGEYIVFPDSNRIQKTGADPDPIKLTKYQILVGNKGDILVVEKDSGKVMKLADVHFNTKLGDFQDLEVNKDSVIQTPNMPAPKTPQTKKAFSQAELAEMFPSNKDGNNKLHLHRTGEGRLKSVNNFTTTILSDVNVRGNNASSFEVIGVSGVRDVLRNEDAGLRLTRNKRFVILTSC